MTSKDRAFLALLGGLAAFIWLRNLGWMTTFDDTLPILIAIPMFFWIEWPWKFTENSFQPSQNTLIFFALFFFFGIFLDMTLFLAIGWTALLWAWVSQRVDPSFHSRLKKLLILPIMAFPWVTLDGYALGWYFRLSGAAVAGEFFKLIGMPTMVDGTQIYVNNIPLSVEAACAGLNTLQSMLIAGSALAYILIGDITRFWWNIPMLFGLAWLSNTLRIIFICSAAVWISPEFAMGPFHDIGGWLVLFIMFILCWGLFHIQIPKSGNTSQEDKQ